MAVESNQLLHTRHAPAWLRNPATVAMPKGVEEFVEKANAYFEECLNTETRPTITGFALAVGLPGPTSLIRLGQRIPELRYIISRCMTAVAYGYEEMIGSVNAAGPLFLLKNIPDFDPDEPSGAPPIQFFNDRKEVLLTMDVAGAAGDGEDATGDPVEVYVNYLRRQGKLRTEVSDEETTSVFTGAVPSKAAKRYVPTQMRRALQIISDD